MLAVDGAECRINVATDRTQAIRLAFDVLAHYLDAIPVAHVETLVLVQRHTPTGLFRPSLSVTAQGVSVVLAAKHDWRRPHLADDDALFFLGLVVVRIVTQRPQVEVLFQTAAMVFVRVAQQERVDERAALGILLDAVAQMPGHIWLVAVGIVGILTNVHIDYQRGAVDVAQFNEGHVTVTDLEERD